METKNGVWFPCLAISNNRPPGGGELGDRSADSGFPITHHLHPQWLSWHCLNTCLHHLNCGHVSEGKLHHLIYNSGLLVCIPLSSRVCALICASSGMLLGEATLPGCMISRDETSPGKSPTWTYFSPDLEASTLPHAVYPTPGGPTSRMFRSSFFMCLLAICTSPLEKCLFKPSFHFFNRIICLLFVERYEYFICFGNELLSRCIIGKHVLIQWVPFPVGAGFLLLCRSFVFSGSPMRLFSP